MAFSTLPDQVGHAAADSDDIPSMTMLAGGDPAEAMKTTTYARWADATSSHSVTGNPALSTRELGSAWGKITPKHLVCPCSSSTTALNRPAARRAKRQSNCHPCTFTCPRVCLTCQKSSACARLKLLPSLLCLRRMLHSAQYRIWTNRNRAAAVRAAATGTYSPVMSGSYSLWIKPTSRVLETVTKEIAAQAAECNAPVFEPHVTLLGGLDGDKEEILRASRELAGKLKKFRINFLDVSQGESFHRCVYILVAKESAIMEAGKLAQQQFGIDLDYMPHLSLLYADISPEQRAASQQRAIRRLYGEGSDYSTLLTDNGFAADSVLLWYTPVEDKTLASWTQVAEFALS